jgi:nucleotidyltransferase substrate binding protein (TIGR01987 family)
MVSNVILGSISIASLVKAFEMFDRFKKNLSTEQEKAGAIQAFEVTFEQTWKTLKKVLLQKGLECGSPRDTFRVAAADGLIKNPTAWFVYLEKRNLTSHTYNPEIVDAIIECFDDFASDVGELLKTLRAQK